MDLSGDIFTGVSDAKHVRTFQSIKTASDGININDLLFAEQSQANLETIDPEATTPGNRQFYQTGDQDASANPTRSYLPAVVFCMQFELNQVDTTDDRDVVLGALRILARQQFMQRRTEYPAAPTSRSKLSKEAVLSVAGKMFGMDFQEAPKLCKEIEP